MNPTAMPKLSDEAIVPWASLGVQALADYRIFRVRTERKQHPRTGRAFDLFALDCPDWVNVVATTPGKELILVGQYRHGTNTVEWEVPGGIIDPGDANPLAGGIRELREETGFEGDSARMLGTVFPNPAIQSNRCHAIRVENCRPAGSQELDASEDIVVQKFPWNQVPELIRSGRVRHSLVMVALTWALMEEGTWTTGA